MLQVEYTLSSRQNESMVSLVSKRYMRGENGTESLMVCLSEYQILRSVSVATGSSPQKSTKNREKKYRLYPKKVQKKYAFMI